MGLMQRHGAGHGGGLALQAFGVNAGARPHPVFRLAAVKPMADRRCNGGVADAHFADAQQVAAAGNGLHAVGHGGGAVGLVHGGFLGDVLCRFFKGQFKHFQAKVKGLADLVHGGPAALEIEDHLFRHFSGIGGNALGHNAVVSGEHGHHRAGNFWRVIALPGATHSAMDSSLPREPGGLVNCASRALNWAAAARSPAGKSCINFLMSSKGKPVAAIVILSSFSSSC